MTTVAITYDTARNALYVSGVATPFPAGSLEARRLGDLLAVANPHDGTLICQWLSFDAWAIQGASFADAASALAALTDTCTRKRPVGDLYAIPVAIAQAGQAVIPLQQPPMLLSTVRVEVNGGVYRAPDIGVTDLAVTWLNPDFPLTPSDDVRVVYS